MNVISYVRMSRRIVASIVQNGIHIIHRDDPIEEAKVLSHDLEHCLQPFFPDCVVETRLTDKQCIPFSFVGDGPMIRSINPYSTPLPPFFLSIVVVFKEELHSKMTIGQFIRLRPVVYPNTAFLGNRRFSGMSSSIFKNVAFSTVDLVDFRPIINQYLSTYSMLYSSGRLPKNTIDTLPEFKSLVPSSSGFVLEENETLVILAGVHYEAHTIIAYGANLICSVHVPFVLVELAAGERLNGDTTRGKAFKVITARHVDEPEEDANLVLCKTLSED